MVAHWPPYMPKLTARRVPTGGAFGGKNGSKIRERTSGLMRRQCRRPRIPSSRRLMPRAAIYRPQHRIDCVEDHID